MTKVDRSQSTLSHPLPALDQALRPNFPGLLPAAVVHLNRAQTMALLRRSLGGPASAVVPRIVDAHHHFLLPSRKTFHKFLNEKLGAPDYLPSQYGRDCADLPIEKTVHVEAMPDMPAEEVKWVHSLVQSGQCKVAAIVASCDLAKTDVAHRLDEIQEASHLVRGVRWILDYDGGPYDGGNNATHVACSRHNVDYLRRGRESLERGVALLADRGLSFDLQCAPAQLPYAVGLFGVHPRLQVVIDHMGKPRHLRVGDEQTSAKIAEWKHGMEKMAKLPQVYVKLSMLGYAVPQWHRNAEQFELLKQLVGYTIDLFGADRCMFASNWHISGQISDYDGVCDQGGELDMCTMFDAFGRLVCERDSSSRSNLFAVTAERFYGI